MPDRSNASIDLEALQAGIRIEPVLAPHAPRQQRAGESLTVVLDEPGGARLDDVVTLTFEDDSVAVMTVGEFQARFAPDPARSGGVLVNGFVVPEAIDLDGVWEERGVGKALLKLFQVDRVKLPARVEGLWQALSPKTHDSWTRYAESRFIKPAVARLAWGLCFLHENKALDYEWEGQPDEREGMLELGPGDELQILRCVPAGEVLPMPETEALLVFIHGTASSTRGSFGQLWEQHPNLVKDLLESHGQIYGWEHRTLTVSPVENALRLLRTLPDGVALDIVSHSRGGLVGELLARAQTQGSDGTEQPFAPEVLAAFEAAGHPDAANLRELSNLLQSKAIKVRRFVRVACPARGTILASARLDRFIGGISAVALKFLGGFPLAVWLSELTKQMARARSDPRVLPGLEAMVPGSMLTRALNDPTVTTAADLHVVAGDVHGDRGGLLRALKVLLSDFFFQEPHDFIVHTAAMSGGTGRSGAAWRFPTTGARVSHFNYFQNPDSASRIAGALAGDDSGFDRIEVDSSVLRGDPEAERLCRLRPADRLQEIQTREARPIVLVLPGIMGSELGVPESEIPVWFSISEVFRGGVQKLRLDGDDRMVASGLLPRSYGRLMRFLDQQHHPVAVPYDWRKSMRVAAAELQQALEPALHLAERWQKPLHIIAHSMGGLVVRTMRRSDGGPALWGRLRASNGRLLMLGVPNRGSMAPAAVFTTRDVFAAGIAMLDIRTSYSQLADIVAEFPGLLELMPRDDWAEHCCNEGSLWSTRTWRALAGTDPRVAVPTQERLTEAQALLDREALAADLRALAADARVLYVAGVAESTPCKLLNVDAYSMGVGEIPFGSDTGQPPDGKRIVFNYTSAGDGRVTWESGVLDEARTWVVPAAHGDLADTSTAFEAYAQLLETGATHRLAAFAEFKSRRGAAEELPGYKVEPAQMARLSTLDSDQIQAAILAGVVPISRPRPQVTPLEVSLVHGNLEYMRFPLLFGQYLDERMSSAGVHVDQKVGGQFELLLATQLFRGDTGELAFLGAARDPHTSATRGVDSEHGTGSGGGAVLATADPYGFGGAIAIGLGRWGELTSEKLARAVHRAVLRMAVDRSHYSQAGDEEPLELRLSSLLIGCGTRSISVRESVSAILRGIKHAAEQLVEQRLDQKVRVGHLEFVELYEDSAHEAAHVLNSLLQAQTFKDWLRPPLDKPGFMVEPRSGGRRRLFWQPDSTLFQRLSVSQANGGDAIELRYVSDRARSERFDIKTPASLVTDLVKRAALSGDETIGTTLYELLLPTPLKERFADFRATELELDDRMAVIPWEILRDPIGPADGFTRAEPLSIRAALIRRRVRADAAGPVRHAPSNTALVIGDPDLQGTPGFSQLPAAAREAREVDAVLSEAGFASRLLDRAAASQVFSELLTSQYNILHIAAHGTLAATPGEGERSRAGVVLGGGLCFSADDVAAIRRVPELVFINCCYLGQDGAARSNPGEAAVQPLANSAESARFAASVGTRFIDIGAKAVVVAGWTVSDHEAAEFAKEFYAQMLAGQSLAQAVHQARSGIYDLNPGGTTWGAYQCYGNPEFRLDVPGFAAARRSFVSPRELAQQIHNYAANVTAATVGADMGRVEEVLKAGADMGWAESPEVMVAQGTFLGRAGQTEEALKKLGWVLQEAPQQMNLRTLEMYANLIVRNAQRRAHSLSHAEARQAVAQAKGLISSLRGLHRAAPANRRAGSAVLELLDGGVALRAAQIHARVENADGRREELEQALIHYTLGFQLLSGQRLGVSRGKPRLIPDRALATPPIAYNGRREADQAWALAAGLLAGVCLQQAIRNPKTGKPARHTIAANRLGIGENRDSGVRVRALLVLLDAEAARLQVALQAFDYVSLNFWDRSGLAELHLARAAFQPQTLIGPDETGAASKLLNSYLDAIGCGPNLYEADSILHRFELVIAAYSGRRQGTVGQRFHDRIVEIHAALDGVLAGSPQS